MRMQTKEQYMYNMDTENIIDNNDNVNENVVEEQYMYNMDTENIIDNNDNVNENVDQRTIHVQHGYREHH